MGNHPKKLRHCKKCNSVIKNAKQLSLKFYVILIINNSKFTEIWLFMRWKIIVNWKQWKSNINENYWLIYFHFKIQVHFALNFFFFNVKQSEYNKRFRKLSPHRVNSICLFTQFAFLIPKEIKVIRIHWIIHWRLLGKEFVILELF